MTIVAKIGGKSQDSVEKAEGFAEQLKDNFGREEPLVLVASAIGNTTDELGDAIKACRADITQLMSIHNNYFSRFGGDEETYHHIVHDFTAFYHTYLRNPSPQLKAIISVCPERLASFLMANAVQRVRGRKTLWLDFYDERFPLIATRGDRNYLSASVDLDKSEVRSRLARELLGEYDVVIPGYGGIYLENGKGIKTFGRGGSDEAAFGCGYGFDADQIWICTDQDGIKAAMLEEPYRKETETLTHLDIEEAKAAAFLGAKLPSEQSVLPLERIYQKGRRPKVYIANAHNLSGDKTEIKPFDESELSPARLVAGRDIVFYYVISGSPEDLHTLRGSFMEMGIDYRVFGESPTRAEIGVFGKGSDIADEIVQKYESERRLFVERCDDRSIVGIVGSKIRDMVGLYGRITNTLGEDDINILSSSDYNGSSTCSVISSENRQKAVYLLYNNLPLIRGNQL